VSGEQGGEIWSSAARSSVSNPRLAPVIPGLIDRRVLVNYQVDPDVLQRQLPRPFRVKVYRGVGIAGVCLIRLARMRPRFLPAFLGFGSENAAHRIAVEWDTDAGVREGVFIPRRDTSSALNTMVGGRLFPGKHHRARFDVSENGDHVAVALRSLDGETNVIVEGSVASSLPESSVFPSLEAASSFFEGGAVGYSATDREGCFECLELNSFGWRVEPLDVERVESSFFSDPDRFPEGSTTYDSALLMRGIEHEWLAHESLRA
jgi:hypothetical protein